MEYSIEVEILKRSRRALSRQIRELEKQGRMCREDWVQCAAELRVIIALISQVATLLSTDTGN